MSRNKSKPFICLFRVSNNVLCLTSTIVLSSVAIVLTLFIRNVFAEGLCLILRHFFLLITTQCDYLQMLDFWACTYGEGGVGLCTDNKLLRPSLSDRHVFQSSHNRLSFVFKHLSRCYISNDSADIWYSCLLEIVILYYRIKYLSGMWINNFSVDKYSTQSWCFLKQEDITKVLMKGFLVVNNFPKFLVELGTEMSVS